MTPVEASLSSGKIGRDGFVIFPDVVAIAGGDIWVLRDGHIQQTLVHAGFEDIINIREERYCPVATAGPVLRAMDTP